MVDSDRMTPQVLPPAGLPLLVDREVELVGRGPGGAVEQVPQGQQPGAEAFEHGHAEEAQALGGGVVDGARQTGEHDHRRVGRGHDVLDGVGVGDVAVVLRHQVDRQRGDADGRVAGDGGEAVAEHGAGVGAATPHVEWVAGFEALVEPSGQGRARRGREGRERHVEGVCEIGHQAAFRTGVVHRRDAATGDRPAGGGQHGERVAELGEVADQVRGDVVGQRLPGAGAAGNRAGVGGHQRRAERRSADGQEHDLDAGGTSRTQRGPEPHAVPHGLEHQTQDAGLGVRDDVLDVVGRRGDELLPRRDGQVEAQAQPGAQERREHRPGMGDH